MKAIEYQLLRFCRRSLSVCLVALLQGCQTSPDWSLTYKLWNNESFQNFNAPAFDPHLELFADESRSDVLVIYDEVREKNGAIRRRAFFANRNLDRIRAGRKPRFVSSGVSSGLKPIPVVRSGSGKRVPAKGLAVLRTDQRHEFYLYSDGRELGPVGLPIYGSSGGVRKTLLTPLTITGDTLIVGTVVGLWAAMAYAQSGASISICP
jgi:hypothetical protein